MERVIAMRSDKSSVLRVRSARSCGLSRRAAASATARRLPFVSTAGSCPCPSWSPARVGSRLLRRQVNAPMPPASYARVAVPAPCRHAGLGYSSSGTACGRSSPRTARGAITTATATTSPSLPVSWTPAPDRNSCCRRRARGPYRRAPDFGLLLTHAPAGPASSCWSWCRVAYVFDVLQIDVALLTSRFYGVVTAAGLGPMAGGVACRRRPRVPGAQLLERRGATTAEVWWPNVGPPATSPDGGRRRG